MADENLSIYKENIELFINKMNKNKVKDESVIECFKYYYKKLYKNESGFISKKDIKGFNSNDIVSVDNIANEDIDENLLKQLVIIKLNGGLGTTIGMEPGKPKSLLIVKNDLSFLEIIMKQAAHINVPLILMNSSNTSEETDKAVQKAILRFPELKEHKPEYFEQNQFPKVKKDDLTPVSFPDNEKLEWNPPGHGDIYLSLKISGLLNKLLTKGIKYAFISNSDNLGAIVDKKIFKYFIDNKYSFLMEVAQKTKSDIKGGHLARDNKGNLLLREIAQCPEDELDDFRDLTKYSYFNTNNVWIDLEYLNKILSDNNFIELDMIKNEKSVNPNDKTSTKIYQIETALGSAISKFKNACAILVNRDRYLPVKDLNHLLKIRSDYTLLTNNFNIQINPERTIKEDIEINIDKNIYKGVSDFDKCFKNTPSLCNCRYLIINRRVYFEENVVIKGDVRIDNNKHLTKIINKNIVLDNNHIY